MPDPALWRTIWLSRFDDYRELVQQRIAGLDTELQEWDLPVLTARRLRGVRVGLEGQLRELAAHFRLLEDPTSGHPKNGIPPAPLSGHSPVIKCYENLFRDWSWGAAESDQSLKLVHKLAPSSLGKLAVYGAGAGRLAVDVHATLKPEQTFALDINPFPLLVLARLTRGEALTLPEFPVGPASEESVVVHQTLRCETKPGPNFNVVFGDALEPPFAPGSLDTVLTSWVIDALDADFRDTASAINQVLCPGGTWINVGPLRFDGRLSEAYSIEEVHQIVKESGFELREAFSHSVDYFKSPHSGSSRREVVFCFAGRKIAGTPRRTASNLSAAWLSDVNLPIPLTRAANALRKSSLFAFGVLSLVDGKRSLADVAQALSTQWSVRSETLVVSLRAFFAKLPLE